MQVNLEEAGKELRQKGWTLVRDVLSPTKITEVRQALDRAVAEMRRTGVSTHTAMIDPNDANIRVYNLPNWDPIFVELLRNPIARALVETSLGPNNIVSNFTANIALPGSESMRLHSDQALSVPPPWNEPWVINIIWCLDDVHDANGATRYVPGSHQYKSFDDVPEGASDQSVAFEASAGSLIAMEGRLWHTSGANVTSDQQRAMMFGYYTRDFLRQQMNWEAILSAEAKQGLDADARQMLGMGPTGYASMGFGIVSLQDDAELPDISAGATLVEG